MIRNKPYEGYYEYNNVKKILYYIILCFCGFYSMLIIKHEGEIWFLILKKYNYNTEWNMSH